MKYEIEYACGHTGTVQLFGKTADRERKVKWLETQICPACEKKERQERYAAEAAEAQQKADELGLPELKGTEKQVNWALTIREQIYSDCKKFINLKCHPENQKYLDWLFAHDQATFWIDNRNNVSFLKLKYKKEMEKQEVEDRIAEDTELVKPQQQKTDVIATIKSDDNTVKVVADKDENIINFVKAIGYKWRDGRWKLKITEKTGDIEDRIIETGNQLLSAGVPVKMDKTLIQRAINGDYTPRSQKWITSDGKYVYVSWAKGLDYYKEAKALPGAVWEYGEGMKVKPEYYEDIREFADLYKFTITPKAADLLQVAEQRINDVRTVNPVKREQPVDEKPDLKNIMKSSRDVLDDLRDD